MREGNAPHFGRRDALFSPIDNCGCHDRLPAGCGSRLRPIRPTRDANASRFGVHPAGIGEFGAPCDTVPSRSDPNADTIRAETNPHPRAHGEAWHRHSRGRES